MSAACSAGSAHRSVESYRILYSSSLFTLHFVEPDARAGSEDRTRFAPRLSLPSRRPIPTWIGSSLLGWVVLLLPPSKYSGLLTSLKRANISVRGAESGCSIPSSSISASSFSSFATCSLVLRRSHSSGCHANAQLVCFRLGCGIVGSTPSCTSATTMSWSPNGSVRCTAPAGSIRIAAACVVPLLVSMWSKSASWTPFSPAVGSLLREKNPSSSVPPGQRVSRAFSRFSSRLQQSKWSIEVRNGLSAVVNFASGITFRSPSRQMLWPSRWLSLTRGVMYFHNACCRSAARLEEVAPDTPYTPSTRVRRPHAPASTMPETRSSSKSSSACTFSAMSVCTSQVTVPFCPNALKCACMFNFLTPPHSVSFVTLPSQRQAM